MVDGCRIVILKTPSNRERHLTFDFPKAAQCCNDGNL